MAQTVSNKKLASEHRYVLEVLAKRGPTDVQVYLSILAEAEAACQAATENGKPEEASLMTTGSREAWEAYQGATLTEDEEEKIRELAEAIAEAEAQAKSAEESEITKVWKTNMKALAEVESPVEARVLQTKQETQLASDIAKARLPHETKAAEKQAEKTKLQEKRSTAGSEALEKRLRGSGRVIERKLKISFTGVWLTTLSKTRGSFLYIVGKNALYHKGSGSEKYTLLGNMELKSATGLQRVCYAVTDRENSVYTSTLKDQKDSLILVKKRFADHSLKELGQEWGWKDQGGSDKTRHVTYSVTDENYDVEASSFVEKNEKLPKPILDALDVSKTE
ncbi:MAG: hypothetical protein ACXADF_14980 [Candidatus Thorarchaeota archaeon]|jgi:hypothetical protein